MRAGTLRHRVAIQSATQSVDDFGSPTATWTTLATVYARVEAISGREYFAAAQKQSEVTHRVTVRYRDDVTPTMRIMWGSVELLVESVLPDERQRQLEIMCVQQSAHG